MAQVEVGLGAVVGDVDLAVLERAHRARVDVDVRVELDVGDSRPRASSSAPMEAAARPLPSELTTPPVTKTYLVGLARTIRLRDGPLTWFETTERGASDQPRRL